MQVRVAQRYPLSYPRYLRPARSPSRDAEHSPLGAKVKDVGMAMPVVGDGVRKDGLSKGLGVEGQFAAVPESCASRRLAYRGLAWDLFR
jgi:hypothetical protein